MSTTATRPRKVLLPDRLTSDMTALASGFARYPAASAAAMTRRAVAGLTRPEPLSAAETVARDRSRARASERSVGAAISGSRRSWVGVPQRHESGWESNELQIRARRNLEIRDSPALRPGNRCTAGLTSLFHVRIRISGSGPVLQPMRRTQFRLFIPLLACRLAGAAGAVASAQTPAATATAFPSGVVSAAGIAHAFLAHSPEQGKDYRIAPNGDIAGEYTTGPKGEDSWLLPDGRLLASYGGGVREFDPATGAITWEYKAAPGVEVHSCQPLPDRRVLICECGSKRLFEINRDLTIAHEIRLASTQPTHHQFRLARKTGTGTYLVAYGSDAVVRELDADGRTLQTFVLPPVRNRGVNGAFRLPNGHTLVTGGYGAEVYEFDSSAQIVWTLKESDLPAGFKLHYLGTAQRLPNGNTVISNFLGLPEVFEVTPEKRVVWQYHNEKIGPVSACAVLDAR